MHSCGSGRSSMTRAAAAGAAAFSSHCDRAQAAQVDNKTRHEATAHIRIIMQRARSQVLAPRGSSIAVTALRLRRPVPALQQRNTRRLSSRVEHMRSWLRLLQYIRFA